MSLQSPETPHPFVQHIERCFERIYVARNGWSSFETLLEGAPFAAHRMATRTTRSHKHFRLDPRKIKRAQKVLRARTETETIERALDFVISEYESRLALAAHERFLTSSIDIKDVYGTLE